MRSLGFFAFACTLWVPFFAGCEADLPPAPLVAVMASRSEAPPTPNAMRALSYARAQVGRPYCWGGVGPRCFDCSGLTMEAWLAGGVKLPRTADDIARALPEIPLRDVRPGDILWWPGHVGLYAGNGWAIEALNARSGVVMRRAMTPRRVLRPLG